MDTHHRKTLTERHLRPGAERSRSRSVGAAVGAAFAGVIAACSTPMAVPADPETGEARDCSARPIETVDLLHPTPEELTLALSALVYRCASRAVVAQVGDVEAASLEATQRDAPLLLTDAAASPAVVAELERLGVDEVVFVGEPQDPSLVPDGAVAVAAAVPPAQERATVGSEVPEALPDEGSVSADAAQVWLAREQDAAWVAAARPFLERDGARIRSMSAETALDRTEAAAGTDFAVLGPLDPTQRWQMLQRFRGPELPGGGVELFPGRRFVAFYGSPITFRLGLLGEQGPAETVERLLPKVAEYQIPGGEPVLPAFELIATVADSAPGDDGDYSNELEPSVLQPWIDAVTAAAGYVIIDLQPGRTDFLTQAKRYEPYLRLPNVGLALDPEWRIGPDQVHLEQIGSVEVAEVNAVVEWMAEIVRSGDLPQKMLIVHQFQAAMVPERELIATPPEVALVIHVDGQGPLPTKYGTWQAMLALPVGPDQVLRWGWKNFLDEDVPMATPAEVNALQPLPVVVTYQ